LINYGIVCATTDGILPKFLRGANAHEVPFLIIDQCDQDNSQETKFGKVLKTTSRGLSASRNIGLEHTVFDWSILSDNDITYNLDELEEVFKKIEASSCDIAIIGESSSRGLCLSKVKSLKWFHLLRVCSWQIVVSKRVKSKVNFDINFGLGAKQYNHGEENIFLIDHLRHGSKIKYFPSRAVQHPDDGTGFIVDDKFYATKVAIFTRIFGALPGRILVMIFFIKKRLEKRRISFIKGFFEAIK
jgi:glycosyltransferase involved in cell wall biosynthesis